MGYAERRQWADKFVNRQKRILAHIFDTTPENVSFASENDDMKRATDVHIGPLKISLRMCRHNHIHLADTSFLIRLNERDGESELTKIQKNGVHYMLNCYATAEASADGSTADTIEQWVLIALEPLAKAADDGLREVLINKLKFGKDKCLSVDIESLADAYGKVVFASGQQSTTTTKTTTTAADGTIISTTTTTTTVTGSVHPSLRTSWSAYRQTQ